MTIIIIVLFDNSSVSIEAAARIGSGTRRFGQIPAAWAEISHNLQDRSDVGTLNWKVIQVAGTKHGAHRVLQDFKG